ncbi:protein phosphatase 2C domain-containing protein [Kitasatospora sp. NPDC056531]|uniref:protein phosphatase 2C domain-containing protein n=1 Tax=Kitasatospora sp. NPDC056531 TaxID=3345856 RepID=UPI0036BDFEF5
MTHRPIFVTSLRTPKLGNSEDECEDALAVWPATAAEEAVAGDRLIAAVSDGASESALAKDWSKTLVRELVDRARIDPSVLAGSRETFAALAADLVRGWDSYLEEYVAGRARDGRPVQWYEEPKFERGAFATLLAVQVERAADDGYRWQAAALGDSCLIQIRDGQLLTSFPLTDQQDFGTTPNLFGSRNRDSELITARTRFATGTLQEGDDLFLATDAMAAWILGLGEELSAELAELTDRTRPNDLKGFEEWVTSLRMAGRLHNDDVALIHIDVA